MDPKERVFENYKYITKVVKKRTARYDLDFDDTLNYVLDKISENDYKKIRSFRGESKFITFLTIVVNRLIYSYARKNRKLPEMPTIVNETPLDILIQEQDSECKEKVLNKLPCLLKEIKTTEKIVIKMRFYKDMKISQISSALNCTRYKVKNIINLCLLFFRKKVKEICKKNG